MDKQVIIAVGREYGSAGHVIARFLSERFNIPYYDKTLIKELAHVNDFDVNKLKDFDESVKPMLTRTVRGHTSSPEVIIANMQFDLLKEKAAAGESFVIVGRCADQILADCDALCSFFITAPKEDRIRRTAETRNMTEKEAIAAVRRHDKHRKKYYETYTDKTWGDAVNYDMTINSSSLGYQRTANIIEAFVKAKLGV